MKTHLTCVLMNLAVVLATRISQVQSQILLWCKVHWWHQWWVSYSAPFVQLGPYLHLCNWVLIFIFDIALEDCCSKSTDSCFISSQHTVSFSTSSAMALINSSLSESPVQILLIRHLNSQLSDRLSFMEYIKSPESKQKETPQKSKSLKLCSCPHKFRTPIIWHKLISKKPTALLSTLRLRYVRLVPRNYQISSQPSFLATTFAETEVLFSSAKRDAKHTLLEGPGNMTSPMGVTRISSHIDQTHVRDSHCSAVKAHLRRWWHKQTVIWHSIVIDLKRCRRRSFFLPLHLFHFKTISCGIVEVATVEIVKVMTTIGPYKSFT